MSTEFVVAGGHRLEVVRFGPEGGTTLVFLHEGLGCASAWRDFPARIAAQVGCGALVYSRWGDGASIALIFAGTAGVRGLVLEAPHVFVEDLSVASIAKSAEEYRSGDLRERLARRHGENVDGAFWGWNRVWLDPEFRRWNIESSLPGVKAPTLIIQGEDDEYGTLAQVEAIERQSGGPVERLVLARCRHAPHRDQPEATEAAVVRFLRRVGVCENGGPPHLPTP